MIQTIRQLINELEALAEKHGDDTQVIAIQKSVDAKELGLGDFLKMGFVTDARFDVREGQVALEVWDGSY